MIALRCLTGTDAAEAVDDLARLRITVFRDWPYLYDGSLEYERDYLRAYARDGAVVVAAYDGPRMIGAATGALLEDHAGDFAAGFSGCCVPMNRVFYCAESVLLPEYRGRGLGHAFFDGREDHARALGRDYCAFCAVIRPDDHPRRPADYRPLDAFWRRRGYEQLPGIFANFRWKDIGEAAETPKKLQFWMRSL
ncbi:MAG: GNAT family N-acetyltransferase [Paracoccus sp. (in: a-proteobacteria)]|nr:GNAT family N-acetyltransferase [Paracoccus sp. (in: a-proteobacteria)]